MMMSDNRACRGPDGAYKVYPKVETLELVNMELEPYEDGWTLFDMFPNLTSFRTRIDSSSDIDSFYALMGLPPGFSVPTDSTHQQHQQQEQQQQQNNPQTGSSSLTALSVHHRPHLGSPPPLRKLSFEIGIALGDCLEMLGTIGQVLAFLGISLTQLHCHNFCLWSYDIIMTTTSLEEHSYRGLEALIIEDPIYLDKFLDSIFTPVPVRSLNTSGSLSKGSVQESDQDQDPVTVPILSTLSWMISLTTLHLKDIHETPEIVPRLNKWLKMFPYLVHFTLDYGLTDLAIFHGMGRIPVHHQQQEAEAEVVEEEFNSAALDSIQLGVGGNPNGGGEEVVGSQQEYILRRPLLKNLKINITGSNLTVDEARASLHGRFPQLTQLIVHSVETSKQ
ncbi:hypothetical protein BGX33_001672 [Mortierella sp. NVP41]|nr:hypothetical protein BGX33_001672 [Mortierella sp. NVP41]